MTDWQPPLPAGYDDSNRAFLQALMSRGSITFVEGQRVLAEILKARDGINVSPASVDVELFTRHIQIARDAVAHLDFDIRNTVHQTRKDKVWAFVNTTSDPATQMATIHTPDEISFVKRLLDAMFDTYNSPRQEVMAVDENQAFKVSRPARARQSQGANGDAEGQASSSDKGLKHSEVLALLKSLVSEGWLEQSRMGFYSLSPQGLMELEHWLTETYNDPDAEDEWQRIKWCEACKGIVTIGQRCADPDCLVRIHEGCNTDVFWRSKGNGKKCPKCKTDWLGKHFVGEKSITSTDAFQRSRKGRKTKSSRASQLEEVMAAQERAEGLDDEEEEEDIYNADG